MNESQDRKFRKAVMTYFCVFFSVDYGGLPGLAPMGERASARSRRLLHRPEGNRPGRNEDGTICLLRSHVCDDLLVCRFRPNGLHLHQYMHVAWEYNTLVPAEGLIFHVFCYGIASARELAPQL